MPDRAPVRPILPWSAGGRSCWGAVAVGLGAGADVRLTKEQGQWQVSEVFTATPLPPVQPVPVLVQQVLSNQRIRLPPAAAADIAAGNLRSKPMQALLALARDYDIDVSIVFKPHPDNVFATNRLSDHTRRRAWDVWAVNGQAVIAESTPDALVDGFLRAAKDAGAYNLGGPRLLSGAGSSPTGPTATTATSPSTATPEPRRTRPR